MLLYRRRRLLLLLALLGGLAGGERLLDRAWPARPESLDRYGRSREVLSRRGRVLRVTPTWRGERLLRRPLDHFSPHLVAALLAAEDASFHRHTGVEPTALVRALVGNLLAGRVTSGASTLTMQLARILEPRRRTVCAKLLEMVRARQLERRLDKDRILELYMNLAPLGGTLRGFEAAARRWFGRSAADLGPAEAATLVALLPAPSRRSPARHPERLRRARNRVLRRLVRCGHLPPAEADRLARLPLGARLHPWPWLAPHACDWLLPRLWGDRVVSRIDLALQRRWERTLREFTVGGVDGVGALALEREGGRVAAMVGSRDWRRRPLNTCLCPRPVGSTLKPFLYAKAMSLGLVGPRTLLADRPTTFHHYRPQNFDRDWAGRLPLTEALRTSRNLPAVHLLRAVGVGPYRDLLEGLGLSTGGRNLHLDLALGTLSASPLQLGRAWRRFVGDDRVDLTPESRRAVVRALQRHSPDLALLAPGAVAWKTGTSSNRRDAWVVGHTREMVVVVWLGNLDGRGAPGLVGGVLAAGLFARLVATLPGPTGPESPVAHGDCPGNGEGGGRAR